MRTDTPQTIYLKDYAAPAYTVDHIDMVIRIFAGKTLVTAKTKYTGKGDADLVLNAERMNIVSVKIHGKETHFKNDGKFLTFAAPGHKFELETEVEICPEENTSLEGLYQSGGTY